MTGKQISRRNFLKLGCLSAAALSLTACGVAAGATALAPDPPPVSLAASRYGEDNMNKRVLITYATHAGANEDAAVEIGKVLGARGFAADVTPVLDQPPVGNYQYVVIGSPVYGSKLREEMLDFVGANQAALQRLPVAFYSVCLGGLSNDPATLHERLMVFDPLRQYASPVAEVLFPGRVNRRSATLFLPGWLARFFPTLDFTRPDRVRAWTQTLFA